jgi:hypothetical protein
VFRTTLTPPHPTPTSSPPLSTFLSHAPTSTLYVHFPSPELCVVYLLLVPSACLEGHTGAAPLASRKPTCRNKRSMSRPFLNQKEQNCRLPTATARVVCMHGCTGSCAMVRVTGLPIAVCCVLDALQVQKVDTWGKCPLEEATPRCCVETSKNKASLQEHMRLQRTADQDWAHAALLEHGGCVWGGGGGRGGGGARRRPLRLPLPAFRGGGRGAGWGRQAVPSHRHARPGGRAFHTSAMHGGTGRGCAIH